MSNFQGYKTYAPIFLIAVHQALKSQNMDVFSDSQISDFVDILLALLAALFKFFSNMREKAHLQHIDTLKQQVIDCKK